MPVNSIQTGETWVLLRGLGREAAHWEDFPDQLRLALPGATVCPVDLPGTGRFGAADSPRTIAEIMAVTRAALLSSSPKEATPRFIVGISMGGMVALQWAAQYPQEVQGVVAMNASAAHLCKPWQRLRPRAWWPLLRAIVCTDAALREQRILQLTSHVDADLECLKRRAEVSRLRPLQLHNLLSQLIAAVRFHLPALHARLPVLLLVSDGDDLVDPICSRALQRALHADLYKHPTANHDLPLDAPEWVIANIVAWRASLQAMRSAIAESQNVQCNGAT